MNDYKLYMNRIVLFSYNSVILFLTLYVKLIFCREKEDRVGWSEDQSAGTGTEYTE
jgi:hypothetical protein